MLLESMKLFISGIPGEVGRFKLQKGLGQVGCILGQQIYCCLFTTVLPRFTQ